MSEHASSDRRDDNITVQQPREGRWAWVDDEYEGAGTRVVEWIDVIDLAEIVVHVGGVRHLQFNANESLGKNGFLSETRWLQSSHWLDLDEMR